MRIKISGNLSRLANWLPAKSRKKGILLMSSFIFYNLLLVVTGLILFSILVPWNIKQKAISTFKDKLAIEKTPTNYLQGMSADAEKLIIEIKHRNIQKLAYVRARSLQKGMLYETVENSVGGIIRYQGQAYRVELRLKGRLKDHWEDENMMSFKVKVKDGKTIMGMRNFDLQHPKTRNYITEWVLHKLFVHAGLIGLRYDFIAVDLNGKGSRIYAIEEGFEKRLIENNRLKEGPIFKFNRDFYWEGGDAGNINQFGLVQDLWGSDLVPTPRNQILSDPTQMQLFNKAKSLVEAFRQKKLKTSDVFDVPKLATFFALIELFGTSHPAKLDNLRFYYNPITALVEPVVRDSWEFFRLEEVGRNPKGIIPNGLMGSERLVGVPLDLQTPNLWKEESWYQLVFQDPTFYRQYIQALERVSAPEFLDRFFDEHQAQLQEKRKILYVDYPVFSFDPSPILYENQQYIRSVLQPSDMITPHLHSEQVAGNELRLDISNRLNFPVEILGASINDSIGVKLSPQVNVLQSNLQLTPSGIQAICLKLPDSLVWTDELIKGLTLKSRILGTKRTIKTSVNRYPIIEDHWLFNDLEKQKSNIKDFECLSIDSKTKCIQFKEGVVKLDKPLVIPSGYKVLATGGTKILLADGASILSYSPLHLVGSAKDPVIISSLGTKTEGIILMNTEKASRLQHVYVERLSIPRQNGKKLSAAITFYQSPVCIYDSFFGGNLEGETYVQIIKSTFDLHNTLFLNAKATALNLDFSKGTISNTQFIGSGSIAIAAQGSKITGKDIWIDQAGEKGIFATEKSTLEIQKLNIKKAQTAIACADLSAFLVDKVTIRDSRIAFAAFQNKSGFGPATIEVRRDHTISGQVEIPYAIEEGSNMKIQFEPVKSSIDPSIGN